MKFKFILLSIAALLFLSCSEELDISEFSDDFAGYEPELRIEAIILPTENTAIVRIDRSILIDEAELYNCIDDDYDWNYYYCTPKDSSYEQKSQCESDCNDLGSECILHFYKCDSDSVTFIDKTNCIEHCSEGECITDDVGEDGKLYDTQGFGGAIALRPDPRSHHLQVQVSTRIQI